MQEINTLNLEGFREAYREGITQIMNNRGRDTSILIAATLSLSNPCIGRMGEYKGVTIRKAKIATLAYLYTENNIIKFACKGPATLSFTVEQWISESDLARINCSTSKSICRFPSYVLKFFFGEPADREKVEIRALEWLESLFSEIAAALPVSNTVAVSIAQDRAKQCRNMIDRVDRAA